MAYALWGVDALDRVRSLVELVLEDAGEGGGAELTAVALAQRALVLTRTGDLHAAEADAVEALQLAAELRAPPAFLLTAGAALLHVAAERGSPPHDLVTGLTDDEDSFFARHLRHARATLAVEQGRAEEGLAGLLAVGQRELAVGWGGPGFFPWRSQAALVLAELGRRGEAARLAAEEMTLAERAGARRALGVALHAAGMVAPEGRSERLAEAVGVLDGSGAHLDHARALVDLGATLRRARDPARSRDPLRRGHELAVRCGASQLAERARQELLAAGARPRRVELSGPGSLTPSERRVVQLAADELTNREIAQKLYVTEKTVEAHLGRAFAKLNVRSRRALADALGEEGQLQAEAAPA